MQSKIWTCAIVTIWYVYLVKVATSDAGIYLLQGLCNSYNSTFTGFNDITENLNSTFRDIRMQVSNGKQYAIGEHPSGVNPAFTMFECRPYMSIADCVDCFDEASLRLSHLCSGSIGGRVTYDGCFLRYERNGRYYGDGTWTDNKVICDNGIESAPSASYEAAVRGLLSELVTATPRTNGLYAASKMQVQGASNETVYALAQCGQAVSPTNCQTCLQLANSNIHQCSNVQGRAIDSGCFVRFSDTPFFSDNQTTDLNPFVKAKGSRTKKVSVFGGVAACVALLLTIIALMVYYGRYSTRRKKDTEVDILDTIEWGDRTSYKYKDLKSATKNFKEDNKLGQGGFGDVYKGILKNGEIVAVKKLALGHSDKVKEDFKSEVKLISNVYHRNLVRLLGYCGKGSELLLVYEYMSNKSLDRFLFGKEKLSLTWKQRFDVILGTAQGLAYLHEQFHVCIIHRDIKCSNILLDNNFQPKIADFGLARLLPDDQTHVSTKIAGTLGYTAPEYVIHGQLSEKVDTYSYGIVVLEVISGRECNEMIDDLGVEYLLRRAWKLYEEGQHFNLVDERLDPKEFEAEEVKRIIKLALMCTQSSPTLRPTMSEVVALLNSKTSLDFIPLKSAPFIDFEEL